MSATLILASASPRRSELLPQLGVDFRVHPADIDESLLKGESPGDYVERMAREKAETVAGLYAEADSAILAADTTVVIDGDVLGKPRDHLDGLAMLARLSGRTHEVITAICLAGGSEAASAQVTTRVQFASLSQATCEAYLATDEPWDKAGAYGIQGLAGAFVLRINGSYSNVVGLPLYETWQLLAARGIPTVLNPAGVSVDE